MSGASSNRAPAEISGDCELAWIESSVCSSVASSAKIASAAAASASIRSSSSSSSSPAPGPSPPMPATIAAAAAAADASGERRRPGGASMPLVEATPSCASNSAMLIGGCGWSPSFAFGVGGACARRGGG